MSTDHRLPTPRIRIHMADDRILEVQALNADQLSWDRTAAKHGWPRFDVVPMTWATFLAWSAARREGLIDGMTWEDFSERQALAVETIQDPDDDDGTAIGDPTLRVVEGD